MCRSLLDRPIDTHPAIPERDETTGILGDIGLVRHQENGDPAFGVEALEDPDHLDARARVEIACRLVCEQQNGIVDQRTRDRDTLLLSARQLIGMVPEERAQTHGFERRRGPCSTLRPDTPAAYSSGSSTFSSADVRGSRWNPWNTNPIS